MPSRRFVVLCLLLAVLIVGWLWRRNLASREPSIQLIAPAITKQPINVTMHMFDPTAPPIDMPPLSYGENAECASDFQSSVIVDGTSQQIDSAHETLTITQIRMTLHLSVAIWVPSGASQHVLEHEQGHRQISEFYYQTADQLAAGIAARYLGKRVDIAGGDLNGESGTVLHKFADEITSEYNKELNPGPTQLLYDSITDHSRNEVAANDAVAAAIMNSKAASILSPANSGN